MLPQSHRHHSSYLNSEVQPSRKRTHLGQAPLCHSEPWVRGAPTSLLVNVNVTVSGWVVGTPLHVLTFLCRETIAATFMLPNTIIVFTSGVPGRKRGPQA